MYFAIHIKEVMSGRCINTCSVECINWRCCIDICLNFPVLSCTSNALLYIYLQIVLSIKGISWGMILLVISYLLLLLCNVRKMIEWIIVCNRVKDNCNIFQLRLILFVVYTFIEEITMIALK